MRHCITAHTEFLTPRAPEYVKYINVTREDDGSVVIYLRNRKGDTNEITLTPDEWAEFRKGILDDAGATRA